MADGVSITSGSGTVIATDDISSVHYQQVKLVDGTLNSTTVIAAGGGVESGALRVTIASDSTGVVSVDDNGSSLTVDNAALSVTGGGVESSALRVTIASDSTGVLSVDDNGGSLTIDNAHLTSLGGAIAGTEVQVDVVAALPAGTNAIGKLAANSGVDIGDVDVTSVIPGTGATNLGKAIDSAAGSTDTGVAPLAIRDDSLSTLTPVEGDWVPLRVNSTGALHVTGGGGGTQYAVDTAAGGTDTGTLALVVRDDALSTLTPADGDYTQLRTTSQGALWIAPSTSATVVDDAAFAAGVDYVAVVGYFADEASTDPVDEGDKGAARMTLDRKQIVTHYAHTAGGCSIFRSLDLDETEEDVKTAAGQVYGMWVTNTATATRFVKFYNATAASVTVGTTTPVLTIGIPGNSSDDVSGHFSNGGLGIAFDTAICMAATTGVADNDTGAPGANEIIVNVFYK